MKLLISDYDGTLNTNNKNLYINIKAINKFRNNGNFFVLATGRAYNSIIREIEKYNIPFDYLICFDGNLVMDKQNNILFQNEIKQKDLDIMNSVTMEALKITEYKFENQTLRLVYRFDSYSVANAHKKVIEQLVPNVTCMQYFNILYANRKQNKKDGVERILQELPINDEDIYTIGDDTNDIEMLQEFNGYRMLVCNPSLYFKKMKGTCTQTHKLIRKLNK